MDFCEKISEDILRNCNNVAVKGIKQRLILINTDDLPYTGVSFDPALPNSLITQLQLLDGKRGYEIKGIKQIMKFSNSFENPEDAESGLVHSLTGIRVNDPSEIIRNEINKFIGGAKVYAVLERKWKGVENKHAFLFFGLKFGLTLSDFSDASDENDGTIVMSLSTPSGYKEPHLPHIYRDTDYPTSLTAFNNKFSNMKP